jgi:hypothetical protein
VRNEIPREPDYLVVTKILLRIMPCEQLSLLVEHRIVPRQLSIDVPMLLRSE